MDPCTPIELASFVDSLWPCDYGLDAFGESGDGFLFSVLDAPVGGPSACTPRGTTVAPPHTPPSPRPAHPAAAQASQPAQEAAASRAAPLVLSVRTKSLRPADAGPPPSPPAAKQSRKRGGDAQPGTPEKQPRRAAADAESKSERRYWSEDERARFRVAMRSNGTDFAEISKAVGTRTATQVRTHVQKYLTKLVRDFKKSAK